jgi:hypothetical protein
MEKKFALAVVLVVFVMSSLAQPGDSSVHPSPNEVVQSLWTLIDHGALTTENGWAQASKIYEGSSNRTTGNLVIIADRYAVSRHVDIRGEQASVIVECAEVGRFDESLHFIPTPLSKFYKNGWVFHLKLRDGQWRIDEPALEQWVTVRAASRYMEQIHSTTQDPVLKSNAAKALEMLQHIKEP